MEFGIWVYMFLFVNISVLTVPIRGKCTRKKKQRDTPKMLKKRSISTRDGQGEEHYQLLFWRWYSHVGELIKIIEHARERFEIDGDGGDRG